MSVRMLRSATVPLVAVALAASAVGCAQDDEGDDAMHAEELSTGGVPSSDEVGFVDPDSGSDGGLPEWDELSSGGDASGGGCEQDCAPPTTDPCDSDDTCTSGVCVAGECLVVETCAELHEVAPDLQSGRYALDLDGDGPQPARAVHCDMDTDGGGWSVVYASDGRDGNVPLVSYEVREGNPLLFEHYNLHVHDKIAVNERSTEFLVRRPGTRWLVADAAPLTPELLMPVAERYFSVVLRGSDGTSANGWLGWSNHHIAGGGDFGIATTDGETCGGMYVTSQGFDHHNENFWNVNCECSRQYLYSLSSEVADGDASYHAGLSLGDWDTTSACDNNDANGSPLYIAVR